MSFLSNLFDGKKTYFGIFVAVVPTLANLIGYDISITDATEAVGIIDSLTINIESVITLVGALIAWYGRKVTKG